MDLVMQENTLKYHKCYIQMYEEDYHPHIFFEPLPGDLHLSKALRSLDPYNLQFHWFLGNIVLLCIHLSSRPTTQDVPNGAGRCPAFTRSFIRSQQTGIGTHLL